MNFMKLMNTSRGSNVSLQPTEHTICTDATARNEYRGENGYIPVSAVSLELSGGMEATQYKLKRRVFSFCPVLSAYFPLHVRANKVEHKELIPVLVYSILVPSRYTVTRSQTSKIEATTISLQFQEADNQFLQAFVEGCGALPYLLLSIAVQALVQRTC